ncbi:hypothetical protein ES705_32966 [subsurface metagenome]
MVRAVQVIPSGEVITWLVDPEAATAQKITSFGLQQTDDQVSASGVTLMVQSIPFGDVITWLALPVFETAQKRPSFGLKQTEVQSLSTGVIPTVQTRPSGDVITRLPVPVLATATNKPPISGDGDGGWTGPGSPGGTYIGGIGPGPGS